MKVWDEEEGRMYPEAVRRIFPLFGYVLRGDTDETFEVGQPTRAEMEAAVRLNRAEIDKLTTREVDYVFKVTELWGFSPDDTDFEMNI